MAQPGVSFGLFVDDSQPASSAVSRKALTKANGRKSEIPNQKLAINPVLHQLQDILNLAVGVKENLNFLEFVNLYSGRDLFPIDVSCRERG